MIFRQYNICHINQNSHSFPVDILGAPPNLWTKWEPDYHLLNNYILDIWDILNMSWTSLFWTCLEHHHLNMSWTSSFWTCLETNILNILKPEFWTSWTPAFWKPLFHSLNINIAMDVSLKEEHCQLHCSTNCYKCKCNGYGYGYGYDCGL